MDSEFKIEHQSPHPVVTMRFHASVRQLPERFAATFGALARYLVEMGVSPGPTFAIYHGVATSDLDVEAGFLIDRSLPGRGDIRGGQLPEGNVATCVHTGPYRRAGAAYSALSSWLHGQGLAVAGPFSEFYLNDPAVTPEDELRTRISVPIETVESL